MFPEKVFICSYCHDFTTEVGSRHICGNGERVRAYAVEAWKCSQCHQVNPMLAKVQVCCTEYQYLNGRLIKQAKETA